jgi:hypothetical protein
MVSYVGSSVPYFNQKYFNLPNLTKEVLIGCLYILYIFKIAKNLRVTHSEQLMAINGALSKSTKC